MSVLRVATCQFPVDRDIRSNLRYVRRQMRLAKERGADVAHFPEGALSGYAGSDFDSFDGFDWNLLEAATADVLLLARQLGIWVVLGSAHRLSKRKPHNSLYIVNGDGAIVERYDKRFCGGTDLDHYSPGNHFSIWTINSVRCGALICYDYRYPELYRRYKKLRVDTMFHSYHAAHASPERFEAMRAALGRDFERFNPAAPTYTYPGVTMGAVMTAEAACNHIWISCPNSSAPESCWPSFFVRADGVTLGRLRRNVAGVLVSTVDTSLDLYDSTVKWRERAMRGVLHSGTAVRDPRSDERTTL